MINNYLIFEKNFARQFCPVNGSTLDYFFLGISYLGELAFIWLVAAFLALYFDKKRGKKTFILFLILAVLYLVVINLVIKGFWYRPRPYLVFPEISAGAFNFWARIGGSSFPSGHTTMATAAGIFFGYFYPKFRIPIVIFVILTAISRIALCAHYLSDVLAGFVIGVILAVIVLYLNKMWFKNY